MDRVNGYLKLTLTILIVIFFESIIIGLIYAHGLNSYTLKPLGIVPEDKRVFTTHWGFEVRDYNYSWQTRSSGIGVTLSYLEIDVKLYNYGNWNATGCYAFTRINDESSYVFEENGLFLKLYSISYGENLIEITRFENPSTNLTQFGWTLQRRWERENFYNWTMSEGVGEATYKMNPLYPDQYEIVREYVFSQKDLLNTALYYWLPTIAVAVAVAIFFHQRRKQNPKP